MRGAVDDGLHRQLRLKPRRRAHHRDHRVKFGGRQHHVQGGFHHLITGAGQGQVQHPAWVHRHAQGVQALQGLGTGRLDHHAANAELIDQHGRATASGGDHADTAQGLQRVQQGPAHRQGLGFEQGFQNAHPRHAAVFEIGVGDVVLTGQGAGVALHHVSRHAGAAQFIDHHRLATLGRSQSKSAQGLTVVQAFQEQHIALDLRVVQGGGADFAHAQIDLVAHRDQAGKTHTPGATARDQGTDHAAAVRHHHHLAHRHVGLGKRGIGGQGHARTRIDHAQAAGPDEANTAFAADVAQGLLTRQALGTRFGKPTGQHRDQAHTQTRTFAHRVDHGVCGGDDKHMLGHFGQAGQVGPSGLALHLGTARIDRVNAPGKTGLAQKHQRAARCFAGVVRRPHHRHAVGRQQHPRQFGALQTGLGGSHR